MRFLFYFLYNLMLHLLLPFVWIAAYFNDKLAGSLSGQKEIRLKLNAFNKLVDEGGRKPIIWLHAASAGEFEQIRPFLSRLLDLPVYVFQTFTSPTIYYKVSHSFNFHGVSFLPWDTYPRVQRFIRDLKPDLFINTRHDIWPNLLLALRRNRVRNILVNANMYPKSKRLLPVFRQANASILGHIDHIYTGSDTLKKLIESIYSGPLEVVGDSRFDQVAERAKTNNSELIPAIMYTDRRVIIYGSVIASDLPAVSEAIAITAQSLNCLHVIVPHEVMERDLTPWEVAFFRLKLNTIRMTELESYKTEPIIIWNRVGQLADLYKVAHLAYVGAGFGAGVHSVTEPAIYLVPSAHGPKYDILAEAIDLVELGASSVIHSESDLADFLSMSEEDRLQRSKIIEKYIGARLGATEKVLRNELKTLMVLS